MQIVLCVPSSGGLVQLLFGQSTCSFHSGHYGNQRSHSTLQPVLKLYYIMSVYFICRSLGREEVVSWVNLVIICYSDMRHSVQKFWHPCPKVKISLHPLQRAHFLTNDTHLLFVCCVVYQQMLYSVSKSVMLQGFLLKWSLRIEFNVVQPKNNPQMKKDDIYCVYNPL